MPLAGGLTKELSGLLGDQVRFLRWKSAVHILRRAKAFCDAENISPRDVPIKFIVPFLEASSFEDVNTSQSLADMWASLLASAVTSFKARHSLYIDILRKLSSSDAVFLRDLYSRLKKEEIYSDDGIDPDLWNANDKQDQIESFVESFRECGKAILRTYQTTDFIVTRQPYTSQMNECVRFCVRSDIVPINFDLALYTDEGRTNGISSPFGPWMDKTETIFNLVSLGLMEKFEVVAWYPRVHRKGVWAARGTVSFALLTSLGLDFMRSCIREEIKRPETKKRDTASAGKAGRRGSGKGPKRL